jgi:hypothetical protein
MIRKLAYLEAIQNGVRNHIMTFFKYPPKRTIGINTQ